MNGRDGVADEHGDVRIDGLVPGTYAVGVTCPNAASSEKYDPMVVGGDRALTGLVWKVTPGFAIRGRVTDEKGQPLAGASIEAGPSARGEPRGRLDFGAAKTQKDGTFAIRGLVGGTYRLEASHAAFATPDEALELTVRHDLDDVKIVLSGGGKIAGSVNDDHGAPIGNAEVEGSAEGAGQATRTRDDGTLLLEGVKPGAWHVVATQDGHRVRARSYDKLKRYNLR